MTPPCRGCGVWSRVVVHGPGAATILPHDPLRRPCAPRAGHLGPPHRGAGVHGTEKQSMLRSANADGIPRKPVGHAGAAEIHSACATSSACCLMASGAWRQGRITHEITVRRGQRLSGPVVIAQSALQVPRDRFGVPRSEPARSRRTSTRARRVVHRGLIAPDAPPSQLFGTADHQSANATRASPSCSATNGKHCGGATHEDQSGAH